MLVQEPDYVAEALQQSRKGGETAMSALTCKTKTRQYIIARENEKTLGFLGLHSVPLCFPSQD